MRKVEVESWEQMMAEELAGWEGVEASADELLFDEFAVSEAYEELRCGERELDRHRWELDPASAEDYVDRTRHGRNFGH